MALSYIASLVGLLAMGLGGFMLAPMAVSLFYGEAAWSAFFTGALVSSFLGGVLFWLCRDNTPREMSHREGVAVVAFAWVTAGILGGLPLGLSGDFPGATDAIFESVSGFTTTGASVLADVEAAGKGVLFWRSLTQWLGGMGFIVLSVAIFPFLGVGGMQLYKAEVPSPTPDKLKPRIADTARSLWKAYALLTVLEFIILMLGGLGWFDSICHALATMATGGFSTKNASVAGLGSTYAEWVVTVFMVLAGINFTLHFQLLRGRWRVWGRDEECRFYLGITIVACLAILIGLLLHAGMGLGEGLRLAAFQTTTILTTTGFTTADYSLWPAGCLGFLVAIMFIGGSAGSTGGGAKVMRVVVVLKHAWLGTIRLIHPHLVAPVKMNGRVLDKGVVDAVWAFLGAYLGFYLCISLLLAILGLDLKDAFTASIACLGNIGPGLGSVGPAGNYAALPAAAKWLLSLAMIAGRLEIYTLLVLLAPEFWRD